MRFFFRSRQFKIILSVAIILIGVTVACVIIGGKMSPQANIMGTIAAPFRTAVTKVSNAVTDFVSAYTEGNDLMIKNSELQTELNTLREQLADYEKAVAENEFYKNYLEIKENNSDFKFAPATLISRNKEDPYKGFIINKGSVNGIAENDPVITGEGLVGYISEVGLTTAKVVTVLSPDLTLGALDNRTSDSGIVSGSLEQANEGQTKMLNLSRSCNVAIGDYVVSSGEGIFPEGLLIGTIQSIGSDEYNTSIYAAVKPFVELDEIREVMVITEFKGQGGLIPGGEK